MNEFRRIPSIEQLISRPALDRAVARHGRDVVTQAARDAARELRLRFADDTAPEITTTAPDAPDEIGAWLESRTLALAHAHAGRSLRRVINATGVIIHTNLGRAPLADAAVGAAARIAAGYSNLEFDLGRGDRGHRHVHAERLLCSLTGAEAAVIVNNAAAAALLALKTLATGREVIVSRGELVEIGGGFRVPDILAQSGAILREVGTTNRTRIGDYAAAISARTGVILRVHPSNFHIHGFTERPALPELASLARRFNLPVVEDLGSGWLGVMPAPASLVDEPSVRASLVAGIDLVIFSGDKLLGGPQAGIVVGRRELVSQLRTDPLMRALRADKLTYAALEATLALWSEEPSRLQVPVAMMLSLTTTDIERRVAAVVARLSATEDLACEVVDGDSTVGGGSASQSRLPTKLLAVSRTGLSAPAFASRLRQLDLPIVGRIHEDRVLLDLRTVAPEDDVRIVDGLIAARSAP
jgi:L-seryl-tRNA(Ser) seleniumtransferase